MSNVLRALVSDGQVSLTIADTTEVVRRGIKLHNLTSSAAVLFGRALSVAVFQGACLKERSGELSFSVKGDGLVGDICVSVDFPLNVRGYPAQSFTDKSRVSLGETGDITVIRKDGYSRPFVGTSPFVSGGDIDAQFEEYYRVSEQLPTRIFTEVRLDEQGTVSFAGVVALQPLPFASVQAVSALPAKTAMSDVLFRVEKENLTVAAQTAFGSLTAVTEKTAEYRCHCSKEYLGEVLTSLGETQMRQIIREDGAVHIHCHYCNRDYQFTDEDADALFSVGKGGGEDE